jgi:uncharacterized protein (TIGR00725 family)
MEEMRSRPMIAVIGGATCTAQEAGWAEAAGRELAQRGALLVCGGRSGVMEAACRGAKAGGGLTIGLLPGTDRGAANSYVDIAIPTGLGEARNAVIIRSARAVIAIGGEYGTLSEIAFALKQGLPVAGLGTWQFSREDIPDDAIFRASSPEEAVDWVFGRLREQTHGRRQNHAPSAR